VSSLGAGRNKRVAQKENPMRFYTGQHRFSCGIDLHAHTMYVCVLDAAGEIVLERNLAATPEAFLEGLRLSAGHARDAGPLAAQAPPRAQAQPAARAPAEPPAHLQPRRLREAHRVPEQPRGRRRTLRRRADHYDKLLVDLELRLVRQAKREAPNGFHLLLSIPGIGKVLAMTIVYELHDVKRFERVQQFASYARLVKCAKESAGKRKGTSGAKMGNVHLKWAFSEAAVLFVRHSAEAKALLARLTQRHGKGKALSILAHKIGRAAYYVLVREKPFDAAKFFAHAR
jgi:hypothetical protein